MGYNPKIHHRRSIRLKGYDYSQPGLYFVTICVQNRQCLFGNVKNKEMILNDAGNMVGKWYNELGNKFHDIHCDEMIVMPNHFHCIIHNIGPVGTDLRVCPDTDTNNGACPNTNDHVLNNNAIPLNDIANPISGGHQSLPGEHHSLPGEHYSLLGEHIGSPLHRVIQWFKTMTTNEYIRGVKKLGWQRFNGKLWQRNYYEHIIRNERSYCNISNYIINNPANWHGDTFYDQ